MVVVVGDVGGGSAEPEGGFEVEGRGATEVEAASSAALWVRRCTSSSVCSGRGELRAASGLRSTSTDIRLAGVGARLMQSGRTTKLVSGVTECEAQTRGTIYDTDLGLAPRPG